MNSQAKNSANLSWRPGKVNRADRERLLKQRGLVIWFTGLSGSGKSTIAIEVEKELFKRGRIVYRLDGDVIRSGLNSDLGFTATDRDENIRRIAEVAALFQEAGLIVLVCFIAPFKAMRDFARKRAGVGGFVEVYVKADLATCAARDPKGLYGKAGRGEIVDFTGITSPYEEPENPELVVDTVALTVPEAAARVLALIDLYQIYK